MSENKQNAAGGVGFGGLLLLLFIGLKLTGNIAWSWLWVLSPAWITASLVVLAIILMSIGTVISSRKVK